MTTRRFRPRGIKADRGLSYAKIERIAQRVRVAVGLKNDDLAAFPCCAVFERLDTLELGVVPLNYAVAVLEPTVEGKTRFCARTGRIVVVLAEGTYDALQRDDGRARFSMLHELGHAVLHQREVRRLADALHPGAGLNKGERHWAFQDTEWQADALAAATLMPARGLAELDGMDALAHNDVVDRYGASRSAARNRLQTFGERREELLAASG